MDMSGKTLFTNTFQLETQLDISTYPAGILFVEVVNANGKFTQKVIKSK
jgi:hypothetical protein